jgi:hypothetical protein
MENIQRSAGRHSIPGRSPRPMVLMETMDPTVRAVSASSPRRGAARGSECFPEKWMVTGGVRRQPSHPASTSGGRSAGLSGGGQPRQPPVQLRDASTMSPLGIPVRAFPTALAARIAGQGSPRRLQTLNPVFSVRSTDPPPGDRRDPAS